MGGSESKAQQLRDTIEILLDDTVSASDAEFWDSLVSSGASTEEVFALLQPDDVRRMKNRRPRNLATLIEKSIAKMNEFVVDPRSDQASSVMGVVRMLTRIMPFLLEDSGGEGTVPDPETGAGGGGDPFVEALLWGTQHPTPVPVRDDDSEEEEDEEEEEDGEEEEEEEEKKEEKGSKDKHGEVGEEEDTEGDSEEEGATTVREPLGKQLVHATMRLLFIPGLSLSLPHVMAARRRRSAAAAATEAAAAAAQEEEEETADCLKKPDDECVWSSGVQFHHLTVDASTSAHGEERYRTELLRLLLVCLCDTLYQNANDNYRPTRCRLLKVATAPECPMASALFYSLLNTVCAYDPVGWGVPYGAVVSGEGAEAMVNTSLHVLLLLLDFDTPGLDPELPLCTAPAALRRRLNNKFALKSAAEAQAAAAAAAAEAQAEAAGATAATAKGGGGEEGGSGEGEAEGGGEEATTAAAAATAAADAVAAMAVEDAEALQIELNVYRSLLLLLHTEEDFLFLFNALARLLNNVHESQSTLLPSSQLDTTCCQELLILLWKLVDENKAFLELILRPGVCDVNRLVVPVCYLLYTGRKDISKLGLMHICTFLLMMLSGERNFAVALNKPFNTRLPMDLPLFHGCHADLLVLVLHRMVVSGSERLTTLYTCFLTVLANVSPYCKQLALVSSVKLMNLFELFSSPRFLYAAEGNHHYVVLLLEVLNNIIQYQYAGNSGLVYAIVRRRDALTALLDLAIEAEDEEEKKEGEGEGEGGGKKGKAFKPTNEWLQEWKSRIPADTLQRVVVFLTPQVEALCTGGSVPDEQTILTFLANTTLVGLLPVPHPLVVRKYQPNQYTSLWFTSFIWGRVFMHNQAIPIFDGNSIKLFSINLQNR